ncbi:MAG: pyridoxal-phosphate dependent enzyme [Acidobacteria bacterium]|nr:pyridoxal-phosphate dependent enzyme [Acidobacteriota bacterium]
MPDSCLKCLSCAAEFPHGLYSHGCPKCGEALEVAYRGTQALENAGGAGIWRFAPRLPVPVEFQVSLGEGNTPLVLLPAVSKAAGLPSLYFKNETANPTWSFKDRFHAAGFSAARMLGYGKVVTSTTGNHGVSAAAYAAAAGVKCVVFCHQESSPLQRHMIGLYGALPVVLERQQAMLEVLVRDYGYFPATTMAPLPVANAYGVEGYKTIAYEIWQQLGRVPDHMVCPISAGDALYGPWKGFGELRQMGLTDRVPVMHGAQASGCCPYVKAFRAGDRTVAVEEHPHSIALSIRDETGGRPALQAIYDSGGSALDATEEEIVGALRLLASAGILVEPASATALACALKAGFPADETVVCLLTGSGAKWPETMESIYDRPILENPTLEELAPLL